MIAFTPSQPSPNRREALLTVTAVSAVALLPSAVAAQTQPDFKGSREMSNITSSDGTEVFFKDCGPKDAQPIVFHHGWPLSSDDWDNQMLFFVSRGYRVIAHDRRGHGRSSQTDLGYDMDT